MGSAEMLVMGMLDLMAMDLSAPVSAVGVLVSANALGIASRGAAADLPDGPNRPAAGFARRTHRLHCGG